MNDLLVNLKDGTYFVGNEIRSIQSSLPVFNQLINRLGTFSVKGEKFKFRMRLLKSGTSPRPRWTSEKKIRNISYKKYIPVREPYIRLEHLRTFYNDYSAIINR